MKSFIINIFLTIFILCILVIGFIFYLEYTEQPSSHWDNTNKLQYNWIPTWFPSNATNIYEQHDIDTNEIWIKFEILDDNTTHLMENFNELSHEEVVALHIKTPFMCNWWFKELIEQAPTDDTALYAKIYQGNNQLISNKTYLAIDKASSTYYIWITGS